MLPPVTAFSSLAFSQDNKPVRYEYPTYCCYGSFSNKCFVRRNDLSYHGITTCACAGLRPYLASWFVVFITSVLKMVIVCFSETFASTYETTRR
jgi:hypothetical protein